VIELLFQKAWRDINRSNRRIVSIQRNKMALKPISMPVGKVETRSPTTKSPTLAELATDYQTATEQYSVIVRYLKAGIEVLSEPECQLLLEFAEIQKNHCERLHAELQDRLVPNRWVHNARVFPGGTRHEAIIKNSPYVNKRQLVSRKVIPQATYNKIADRVMAKQGKGK
jgi:hypothetical protein